MTSCVSWSPQPGGRSPPRLGWLRELTAPLTIRLIGYAPDFPDDGPILVITDAWIDRVRIKRDHAFLIPAGAVLPFPARGPVFRFS